MIYDVVAGKLHVASHPYETGFHIWLTVSVPIKRITATIALSSLVTYWLGADNGPPFVHCRVLKAAYRDAQNQLKVFTAPDVGDHEINFLQLDRCVSVTFELLASHCEAMALATVYVYDEAVHEMSRVVPVPTRHALISDKKSGQVLSVHHLQFLPGGRVPTDRFLTKTIRDCAAKALEIPPRTLQVTFHEEPDFYLRPGLMVERSSGKLRVRPKARSAAQ
jgi:hypothetical protein